jgi:site-specific DNA-cytosine methylase
MALRRPRTSPPRSPARTLSTPRSYGVLSLFCGLGGKTLGFLRARGAAGSRFHSVGAIDESELACRNFKLLTGETATALDIGLMEGPDLALFCERPDVVIMSPPCKGWSGCLPDAMSKLERYQRLNRLALHSLKIVLDAWETPPALILFENVPRILSRGKQALARAKKLLRARGYEVDIRTHNCGEIGGLGQNRERVLIVARHSGLAPSPLLRPDPKPVRSIGDVLWDLPVPIPGGTLGGPMHALPQLAAINWARLAAIRAAKDWRDLPAAIRIGGPEGQHAGKYGVHDPDRPAHTVLGQARTGKSWSDVADPRVAATDGDGRQSGLYGVCSSEEPGHTVVGAARAGSSSWASVTDPRLGDRDDRQNGGFGVNAQAAPAHAILGEGTVRNTFASVADARLGCSPRNGTMWVADRERPAGVVIGVASTYRGQGAVVDPRLSCQPHARTMGVGEPARPSTTIIGAADIHNSTSAVADHRGFEPTHRLVAGQPLTSTRADWVAGTFELFGPEVDLWPGGRPCWLIIEAPDGCVHRPMTDLELAALQNLPVWHIPGDPRELAIGASGGQWLVLEGTRAQRREQIGNAVPPAAAQAIAERVLELLDAGAEQVFRLSAAGIWVRPRAVATTRRGPWSIYDRQQDREANLHRHDPARGHRADYRQGEHRRGSDRRRVGCHPQR